MTERSLLPPISDEQANLMSLIDRRASFTLVYGPANGNPMAANVSDSASLLTASYMAQFPEGEEATSWVVSQVEAARRRTLDVCNALGIRALTSPRPDHGTGIIDSQVDHEAGNYLEHSIGERPLADAVIWTPSLAQETYGFSEVGSMIAPADCVVANLVFKEGSEGTTHGIVQIHAGHLGLSKDVIGKTIDTARRNHGLDPRHAVAYIGPHASSGYTVHGPIAHAFNNHYEWRRFVGAAEAGPQGVHYPLYMGELATAQLVATGVPRANIILDPTNTLTDPRLPSHRNQIKKLEQDGIAPSRFGIILGMR